MTEKPAVPPSSVTQADSARSPLFIDFHSSDGRIYGFPYGHLLNYLAEKNPDAALQPNAPADRFSLWFSTHDVILTGWRLSSLVPLLRYGLVASICSVESRYYGLSKDAPFVSFVLVRPLQPQ